MFAVRTIKQKHERYLEGKQLGRNMFFIKSGNGFGNYTSRPDKKVTIRSKSAKKAAGRVAR